MLHQDLQSRLFFLKGTYRVAFRAIKDFSAGILFQYTSIPTCSAVHFCFTLIGSPGTAGNLFQFFTLQIFNFLLVFHCLFSSFCCWLLLHYIIRSSDENSHNFFDFTGHGTVDLSNIIDPHKLIDMKYDFSLFHRADYKKSTLTS